MNKIFIILYILFMSFPISAQNIATEKTQLTYKKVKISPSLDSLKNESLDERERLKTIKLKNISSKVSKLKDNQGNEYLGTIIERAELSSYLMELKTLLGPDFQQYRAFQAARDHDLFHMTLLSPPEYKLVDKALIEKLLAADSTRYFTSELSITLLGLGKVERDNKKTFFIVAQSREGQLIRQQLLLKKKDFHITLGFNPSDIYGVTKDSSTLIKF